MTARLLYGGIADSSTWRDEKVESFLAFSSGGVFGCRDDYPMPDICPLQIMKP